MKMMKKSEGFIRIFIITGIGMVLGLGACKPTEKSYRAAYEKAIAENDRNVTEFENTVYNRYREQMQDVPMNVDGQTINTKMLRVKVTEGGGGIREWLKKYSVVVAEFKQKLNANSMRTRFAEGGYPRSFLVENPEPYYYVIAASSDDLPAMAALADSIKAHSPVPLKPNFPYILQMPGR